MKSIIILCLLSMTHLAFGYEAVDRLKLIEDRLKLQESLQPFGHDFFLDTRISAAGDFLDLRDDLTDLQNAADSGGDTTTLFNNLTNTWDGREFSGRFSVDGGIPLFKFKAWGAEFTPELLRFHVGVSMNVGILSETLSAADIISFLPESIPQELRTVITGLDFSQATPGDDLLDFIDAQDTPTNDIIDDTLLAVLKTQYSGLVTLNSDILNALNGGNKIPNANIYAKVEAKVGPKLSWEKGHFFGSTSLYALGRMDYNFIITSSNVENMQESLELPEDIEEWNMALDASLGYRNSNYSVTASFLEAKLFNLSEAENANLQYENPVLFKLQADAHYNPYSFMKLHAYGGFHKRDGYEIADGAYVGVGTGLSVWKERLGIKLRTQLDRDHLTLTPNLKFWIMQVDGMYKVPIADERNGVEISPAYSVNVRLFI
ncbi:MAG: hypothetical protein CME61_01110 [Halobacteriovoraceae bacterium]|nr:hypothetical protein [Halobacteriovoraceae bacterium]